MYDVVEFVCSGNNGRSPVAEATGVKLVGDRGLRDQLEITSSGTMVDLSKYGDLREIIVPFSADLISNGLLDPDRAEKAQSDPQAVLDEIIAMEEAWRNTFISRNLGLDYSNHTRRQTVVSPGRRLILPIGRKNLEITKSLYGSTSNDVRIELLPEFAGLDIDLEQESFGKGYDDFARLAARVQTVAQAAVMRVLDY